MNHVEGACDARRLDAFLGAAGSPRDDAELVAHLDECPACRAAIEARAADPADWSRAAELLRPSAFDHAGTPECSAASVGHPAADRPASIRGVVEGLAPSDDPRSLGRLDGFEITGVIGAGGMGVVLKAVDPSLDRVVAIKVMAPHLAHDATARRRFSREAKAAAAVLHPNVIPIHCVSSEHATPYLVMAYVRGGSLQKRIEREGPLPTVEILRIAAQIAAGLAVAHEQGLVHRDIKPENILLEEGVERVTITDFGLARAVDDPSMTQQGVIAGTPQYMSPEQARGESIDQRSDLFSLGSVMHALCTGRPPFHAPTTLGVMRRICEDAPPPILDRNPEIPEWLGGIVGRLMAKAAGERFESAREAQVLLEACLGHVQRPATTPLPELASIIHGSTPGGPPAGRARGHRIGVTLMVGTPILGLVLLGFALGGPGGPSVPAVAPSAESPSSAPAAVAEPPAEWSLGHGYSRRGEHVYFDGQRIDEAGREDLDRFASRMGRRLVLAHDVDAASFVALDAAYAKDRNTVYYKWISPGRFWVVEIPDADPATFEVLDFNLARDANRVWRTDEPIRGADAATAQVVNPGWVWRDRSRVYYQGTPLVGVDPETFRHLGQAFYCDADNVYWGMTRLDGADVNTFRTFGNNVPYAVDERQVWAGPRRIPGVDPATFRLLHNHVYADAEHVYVGMAAFLVQGADAATFRKVKELDAAGNVLFRDAARLHVYDPSHNEVLTVDPRPGGAVISKPVWHEDAAGRRRHAATVTAVWTDGGMTEPAIEMQPGFEGPVQPDWEIDKMKRMAEPIRESLASMGTVAGGGVAGEDEAEGADRAAAAAVDATPTDSPRTRLVPKGPWDADVAAFDAHLATLSGEGRIPSAEELANRIRRSPMTEVMPITSSMGGYVDLKPAPDTLQHRVDTALQGRTVRWTFDLAEDAAIMYGATTLVPDLGFDTSKLMTGGELDDVPHLMMIMLKEPAEGDGADQPALRPSDLRAGDRVVVEGRIGDFSRNSGVVVTTFEGPVTIYHLGEIDHPMFWIGLVDATVRREER